MVVADCLGYLTVAVGVLCGAYVIYRQVICGEGRSEGYFLRTTSASGKNNTAAGEINPEVEVNIYFGSQTGTAEMFAKELSNSIRSRGHSAVSVVDLEEFEPLDFLEEKYVIFIVATYGEGEPTDNAVDAYRWFVSKERDPACLEGIKYALFSLGNRQYCQFNAMGRRMRKQLNSLGATEFAPYGEGDDDEDIETDFLQWKERFLVSFFKQLYPNDPEKGVIENDNRTFMTTYIYSTLNKKKNNSNSCNASTVSTSGLLSSNLQGTDVLSRALFSVRNLEVLNVTELRQKPIYDEHLSTCHVDLKLPWDVTYTTADTLHALPPNSQETVLWFIKRLNIEDILSKSISFETTDRKVPFPCPCTLDMALRFYTALSELPCKKTLKELAKYIKDKDEARSFERLLSDTKLYKNFIIDYKYTLAEFLDLFMSSAEFVVGEFLQLLPRQKLRPYTIASSSLASRDIVSLTVTLTGETWEPLAESISSLKAANIEVNMQSETYRTKGLARKFQGLCSGYICNMVHNKKRPSLIDTDISNNSNTNTMMKCYVKKSPFKLPSSDTQSVLMIATGSGIAPFRAFITEMELARRSGSATLVFGCTHSEKDYLYKNDMESALEKGILQNLICAFSRQKTGADLNKKVYVQDKLIEHKDLIKSLLDQDVVVFVCGALAMAAGVQTALCEISADQDVVSLLRKQNRYHEEVW